MQRTNSPTNASADEHGEGLRVVVVGCGRIGSELACAFDDGGLAVSVIDIAPGAFSRLGPTFKGTMHEGPGYDLEVMRDAGVEAASALIAATDSDNVNAITVHVAKQVFGVPVTIALLNDMKHRSTYRALAIDYVAAPTVLSEAIHAHVASRWR